MFLAGCHAAEQRQDGMAARCRDVALGYAWPKRLAKWQLFTTMWNNFSYHLLQTKHLTGLTRQYAEKSSTPGIVPKLFRFLATSRLGAATRALTIVCTLCGANC
jgi:hypothetical protein